MNIKAHHINNLEITEIISDEILINDIEEGADLLVGIYYQGFDKVILHKKNITANFFDLKNGMAGEILQKISNFRMQLIIVGDFSTNTSNSLKEFIFESNKGRQVNFLSSTNEAVITLTNR